MGVSGHDRFFVGLGLGKESLLEVAYSCQGLVYRLFGIEAHVQGDLVVARTGGVKLSGHVARLVEEARFDVHVDVFQVLTPGEGAPLDLLFYRCRPLQDKLGLLLGDDALACQHAGVGH